MDQTQLRKLEALCTQEEPPFCRAGCPLNVDCRGFIQAIVSQDKRKAHSILDKNMGLTGLVARMCEAPCEQFCLRSKRGGAIAISLLEKFVVSTTNLSGKRLRLPKRAKSVTILGGGPSSLMVAFELAQKGYPVRVFHLESTAGGWLRKISPTRLPKEILHGELQRLEQLQVQFFQTEALDFQFFNSATSDAFYIGQDDEIANDLLTSFGDVNLQTFQTSQPHIFSGGLSPEDHDFRFITDISQGREAATSIDRFLQGASLTASRIAPRNGSTALYTNISKVQSEPRIVPENNYAFSNEEAQIEAERCMSCECLECVKNCVYLQEFDGFPKSYARRIYNNSAIVKGSHQANKLINSCALCDQCTILCPNDFSMANLCLEARQLMVAESRMPPSAHWFGLEEMRSARSEGSLVKNAQGHEKSTFLFYPGCQLAGIRPEQTLRLYDYLKGLEPQTGIWLDCCGIPAQWAGKTNEFETICQDIENTWQSMERPRIITGCTTCLKMFREHLPEIDAISVWSILDTQKFTGLEPTSPLALSDPCTTRYDSEIQAHIRTILESVGQPLAPLEMSGKLTECCGFGGGMASANPLLSEKTAQRRCTQSEATMLTYCAMCRDQLARSGKPVMHLLDLLFPETAHPAEEPPILHSDRRINRRQLKQDVLSRYPEAEQPEKEPWEELELVIAEPVRALMEQRRILEDDIRRVLDQTSKKGTLLQHNKDATLISSAKLGEVTFWVQYTKENDTFHLQSCWSHRMSIAGGQA